MIRLGLVAVEEDKLAELCRRYQVRELAVFGSAARGEMRQDSDVDLLVEFPPEAEIGLLEHAGLSGVGTGYFGDRQRNPLTPTAG